MNCQEVMELMHRHLDNDLDDSEREVLMTHTRQCPDCAAMFERLQLLSAELTSLPKVVPSYSLVDAIMPQLERIDRIGHSDPEETSSSQVDLSGMASRRAKPTRKWSSMRTMSGVIAASIVAGLFLVTYNSGEGPNKGKLSFSTTAEDNASTADRMPAADMASGSDNVSNQRIQQSEVEAESDVSGNKLHSIMDADALLQMGIQQGNADGSVANAERTEKEVETAVKPESEGSFESKGSFNITNKDEAPTNESTNVAPVVPHLVVISPDGKYSAQAEGYILNIYAADSQALVLQLERKNGKLANIVWMDDSTKLTYEIQVEQGATEKYIVDLTTGKENKAAQ